MQHICRTLNNHRITAAQAAILIFCSQKSGGMATMGEIAQELVTSAANAGGLVEVMVDKKGWLIRDHGEEDRRQVLVGLNENGHKVLEQILTAAKS